MPVTLNANSSTGFIATSDTSSILQLQTGGTTAVTVDASQNVGIGTASPAKQLDLAANNTGITTGDPLNTLRFTDTDTTSAAGQPMGRIEWFSSDTDTAGVKAYIQTQATDGSPDADMIFATNHVSGGGTAERMRIQYDGNVGIGTSSPTVKLQVNGVISSNDTVQATSGTTVNVLSTAGGGEGVVGTSSNHALQFRTNNTERARINTSGNLLVGTTTAYGTNSRFSLFVANNTSHGMTFRPEANSGYRAVNFNNSAGSGNVGFIDCTTSATTYSTSSDYRLKHDIQPMTGALAKVAALKPVTYKWNADNSESQGFIAHELQAVVPECVVGEKDAVDAEGNPIHQGIDTSFLVATLTAAIKEQQALITQLQADVAALKGASV